MKNCVVTDEKLELMIAQLWRRYWPFAKDNKILNLLSVSRNFWMSTQQQTYTLCLEKFKSWRKYIRWANYFSKISSPDMAYKHFFSNIRFLYIQNRWLNIFPLISPIHIFDSLSYSWLSFQSLSLRSKCKHMEKIIEVECHIKRSDMKFWDYSNCVYKLGYFHW